MATNGSPGENLTTRQQKAIAALLTERDIKQAAQKAGVGERTLHRWMKMPAFRAALLGAEGDAIDEATRKLIYLKDPAIITIANVMGDKNNTPAVRLRAAQSVLDYLLKLRELRNVEERLAELERSVYGSKKAG